MPRLLTDDDIRRDLSAADAVRWMREALAAHGRGELVAPPRAHTDLGTGRLVFTTGRLGAQWFGYRSYDSLPVERGQQVVVVHDGRTGVVAGVAVGTELGPRRVGGIGGVAADLLARRDAGVVALIGTGVQAWTQLWALAAVRTLREVRVYSRDAERREAFAARATGELGLAAAASAGPREAIEGADIVVLATSSAVPVLDPAWVAPGAYVTTLGPKQVGRAEFDASLVDAVDLAVTDSVQQITAYDPANVLAGTPQGDRLVGLGRLVTGDAPGRTSDGQTVLFCSVGLAGTEVFLLARLLGR